MKRKILTFIMLMLTLAIFANGNTEYTDSNAYIPPQHSINSVKTLIYAEINPLDSIAGRTGAYLCEEIERLTNGSIKIEMHHSGELGNENDYIDAIISERGNIDMARVSASSMTSYGCQYSIFLSLPFIFESREHFWAFANSHLANEFLNEPGLMGLPIRGIFYGEEGFRHFFSSKNIENIEDLEGMNIRISNDPITTGLINSLKANPMIMPFEDIKEAMISGKIDVAEQPIANYKANGFHEVAPFLILDGHSLGIMEVVISENTWNELTPEQRDAIMEAGKHAQEFNARISEVAEKQMLQELKEKGIKITTVEDKTPWIEAVSPLTEKYVTNRRSLYDMIKKLKTEN